MDVMWGEQDIWNHSTYCIHLHNSGLEFKSALNVPNSDSVGVLQGKLVPFVMELNTHLAQDSETLKEDPRVGGAVVVLAHQGVQPGDKQLCSMIYKNTCPAISSIKSKTFASLKPSKSHAKMSPDSP